MTDYFCWRCNHWHDAEYQSPVEDGIGYVCPACVAEREEAARELMAQRVAEHVEQTRRRYEH